MYKYIHEGSLFQFPCANCLRFVQTLPTFYIRHRHVRKHFDLHEYNIGFCFYVIHSR